MGLFKKRNKEEEKAFPILVKYITEARKVGMTDKQIKKKFKEKNWSRSLTKKAFKMANDISFNRLERRDKMARKKDYEDEDDEDLEDDEDSEDDEDDEEESTKKSKVKPVKQKKDEGPTLEQVVVAHEQRIQAIESALFRIRGSI